jgi:hypothetical protein
MEQSERHVRTEVFLLFVLPIALAQVAIAVAPSPLEDIKSRLEHVVQQRIVLFSKSPHGDEPPLAVMDS